MVRSISPEPSDNPNSFEKVNREGSSSAFMAAATGGASSAPGSLQFKNPPPSSSDGSMGSDSEGEFDAVVDASWIELPDPENGTGGLSASCITEKIDSLLTSLSKIDNSTQSGASLNSDLIQLEQQLVQLREDNLRLLSVLETTNEAMKKNLAYAQCLKNDLTAAREDYHKLKESNENSIQQLKGENEKLCQRIGELEQEIKEKSLKEKVEYHQFDVGKEITMQEMSSQIASKDIRINQLMTEVNGLSAELERTRLDLASSHHQQQMVHQGFRPSLASVASGGADEQEDNFRQSVMKEMRDLKEMVEKLRQEKLCLEQRLIGGGASTARTVPSMGSSYSANMMHDDQEGVNFGGPDGEAGDDSHHGGRHRRHRHGHGHRHLRKMEKKLRNAMPVINSAILFKGFQQFSTQQP